MSTSSKLTVSELEDLVHYLETGIAWRALANGWLNLLNSTSNPNKIEFYRERYRQAASTADDFYRRSNELLTK